MGHRLEDRAYFQLYTGDRNVCRVYQMSIGNDEWKVWCECEPFNQRITATISEDGNSIEGRWEYNEGTGTDRLRPGLHTGALGSLDHVAGWV